MTTDTRDLALHDLAYRARVADELAAAAEITAASLRLHAREAAVSARLTRCAEARARYEALAGLRQQTGRLLSQKAALLRRTARLQRQRAEIESSLGHARPIVR
jgi:hypothetical protein